MGLFSDLGSLGLKNFKDAKVLTQEEDKKPKPQEKKTVKKEEMTEKDYLLLREFDCPVCEWKFKSLTVKAGKARQIGHDIDMRIHYEGVDPVKYDVISCPYCGYSAIASNYNKILRVQIDQIKQQVSSNYMPDDSWEKVDEPYTYKQSITRFKLALICAMVKKAKASEIGLLSLKLHWLLESYMKELDKSSEEYKKAQGDNIECMENAFDAFNKAFSSENLPVYGLDGDTMPYIIAALGYKVGRYSESKSIIGRVITSRSANDRIKNLARELKEMIDEKI